MNTQNYKDIVKELEAWPQARLVAVSKTKPAEDIKTLYNEGQRLFGENKAQEMAAKQAVLPADIQWHMLGHLQTNKVKYIAPFVSLIHSVDSPRLLEEINRQALKNSRVINCLLQVHVAQEETKFGFTPQELLAYAESDHWKNLPGVHLCGLMAMATNTSDTAQIDSEFAGVQQLHQALKEGPFNSLAQFTELSMGMSSDYKIALRHGATLIRIGSSIFGER